MKEIRQLGAIALVLGMMAGCNLTSAPPSSLPRVSPKPRVQQPTMQPPISFGNQQPQLTPGQSQQCSSQCCQHRQLPDGWGGDKEA